MSTRFRNSSKYKHACGVLTNRADWYVDLRPSVSASDAQCVAASANHVAVVWESGNAVAVLRADQTGKQKGEPAKVHAHSAQIFDLQFSPFDDNLLATGADDGRLRLWALPTAGLTEDLSQPHCDLQEHRKRVAAIRFHPTANNVLLSGGNDSQALVWDLATSQATLKCELDGNIQGLSWNYTGSLFAAATAAKSVSVWDPRAQQAVQQGQGHNGIKASRVAWLGQSDYFATTGFSRSRDRQLMVWDSRNLSAAVKSTNIDTSTGILEPLFDADTQLLYLAGKGDGNIRVFEMTEAAPYHSEITQFVSDVPTKSACLAPKRIMNVMGCEINRVMKLTANAVAPVSWTVPRKSKVEFADDLFPNTAGVIPAMDGAAWFGGANEKPILVSLHPETAGVTEAQQEETAREEEEAQRQAEEEAAKANKKELPKLNIVRSSKYRHVAGKFVQRNAFFENIKADNSSSESETIKANRKWFSVPWKGTGGLVGVFDINKPHRVSDTPGLIECGSGQLDMDWNPFNDDVLATGLENAQIKIWQVPADLEQRKTNLRDAAQTLTGHYSKVNFTQFNPVASNILASSSYDMTVKLWDVEASTTAVGNLEGIPDYLQSMEWDYHGKRLATAAKDKKLRICDPRNNAIIATADGHAGIKASKVTWMGAQDKLISVGFSKNSERQFSVWDVRKFSQPLGTVSLDTASGIITPYYDEGTGILYILGKGDGTISYYEIVDEEPVAHLLSKFQTAEPQVGVAVLPKRYCDVKKVQIAHMLKLTTKNVQPLHFTVPRTRKEFFQDDVYAEAPSGKPALGASEWLSGKDAQRPMMSLRPSDMTNLSEAPEIERERKYDFDAEQAKRGTGGVSKEQVMDGFFNKVTTDFKEGEVVVPVGANYSEMNDQVDDDEWSD